MLQRILNTALYGRDNSNDDIEEDMPRRVRNDDVMDEHEDECEISWTDEVLLHTLITREHYVTPNVHYFKGIKWNVLYRFKDNLFQAFVGYDDPRSVPITSLNKVLSFEMSLLSADGVSENQFFANSITVSGIGMGRHDRGSSSLAPRCDVESSKYVSNGDKISIKITLREEFRPAVVPLDYDSKMSTGMVGLINQGATCYLNALLQMLFHINKFRKTVYLMPHGSEELQSSTTLALQAVFQELQFGSNAVATDVLLRAFGWTSQDAFTQQDVQEMMRILIDKLEQKMHGTQVDGVLKGLFCGTICSYIRCINVQYESKRREDFYDIQLDVRGCKDVYESLKMYTAKEMLDGENQYDAESLGKQDAEKGVIFETLPPVLTMHLKRFDFDYQRMCFKKNHDHYEFPVRLVLDDFVVKQNCESANGDVPASDTSSSLPKHAYLLHSVLVHAGEVGHGHYYAYIRPSCGYDYGVAYEGIKLGNISASQQGSWFKFNDENVLKVVSREAVEFNFGNKVGANPRYSSAYMLVYIKESEAGDVMEPVTDSDLPTNLTRRLHLESWSNQLQRRFAFYQHSFGPVNFFIEEDIASFSKYTRTLDFVNIAKPRTIQVPSHSTYIKLVLELSKELSVSPVRIRIWLCSWAKWIDSHGISSKGLRVQEVLTSTSIYAPGNVEFLFVEVVPELKFRPENEDLGEAFVTATQATIDQKLRDIIRRELEWKAMVRKIIDDSLDRDTERKTIHGWYEELVRNEGLYSTEAAVIPECDQINLKTMREGFATEQAIFAGDKIGLGCDSSYLTNLLRQLRREDALLELQSSLEDLTQDMNSCLAEFGPMELPEAAVMIFLRVFDPNNILPSLESKTGCEDDISQAQCPMKYIGKVTVLKGDPLDVLYGALANQLVAHFAIDNIPRQWKDLLENNESNENSGSSTFYPVRFRMPKVSEEADDDDSTDVVDPNAVQLTRVRTPLLVEIVPSTDSNTVGDILELGDILILSAPVADNGMVTCESNSPVSWLYYMSHRRKYILRPATDSDVSIGIERLNNRQMFDGEESIPTPTATLSSHDDPIGSLSPGNEVDRLPADSGNYGDEDVPTLRENDFDISVECIPNKPLNTFFSRLKVHYGDDALMLLYTSTYPGERPRSPITIAMQHISIEAVVQSSGYGQNKAIPLSYRFSPFSMVSVQDKVCEDGVTRSIYHDDREEYRFIEIHLLDQRLRQLRNQYLLEQLRRLEAEQQSNEATPDSNSPKVSRKRELCDDGDNISTREGDLLPHWPAILEQSISRDFLYANKLYIKVSKASEISDFVHDLRRLVPIPTNVDEFGNLVPQGSLHLSASGISLCIDALALSNEIRTRNNDFDFSDHMSEYCEASANIITSADENMASKRLRTTQDETQTLIGPSTSTDCNIEQAEDDNLPVAQYPPNFPLLLLQIKRGVAVRCIEPNVTVGSFVPQSWMESGAKQLGTVALQHASIDDLLWMSGSNPDTTSKTVSVFSFNIVGGAAQPCGIDENTPGPFLSYIREDDDYDSLCSRFERIVGHIDWTQSRLSLIVVKRPIPLPQTKKRNSKSSAERSTEDDRSSQSLWEFIHATQGNTPTEFGCFYSILIGIQQKMGSVDSRTNYRHRGIKIS